MTGKEAYEIWAPAGAVWSPWVVPTLFASMACMDDVSELEVIPAAPPGLAELPTDGVALMVDLPGAEALTFGLALARMGFRPISLINAAPSPMVLGEGWTLGSSLLPVVDMQSVVNGVCIATRVFRTLSLDPGAPPAFLLDARRMTTSRGLEPGMFDNRWMVFPEDFPSAKFLKQQRIQTAVLIQKASLQPQEDLAHVLLRWQESDIQILALDVDSQISPAIIRVNRPSRFRSFWYRALAMMGLRRNSAGGFGSVIPVPGSGG